MSDCLICLGSNSIKSPCCNAYYHYDCLTHWLQRHSVCPHCRTRLKQQPQMNKTNICLDMLITLSVLWNIVYSDSIFITWMFSTWSFTYQVCCPVYQPDMFEETNRLFIWWLIILVLCPQYLIIHWVTVLTQGFYYWGARVFHNSYYNNSAIGIQK